MLVASIGVAIFLAYSYGKAQARKVGASHISSRSKAIWSQAAQRDWRIVVLGDSITELSDVGDLCGVPTLNAGISGARVKDLLAAAPRLMDGASPDIVVLAAGTNDSWSGRSTPPQKFVDDYRALINFLSAKGAKVILANIPPVGPKDSDLAHIFDPSAISALNRQIADMRMPTIDLFHAMEDPATGRLFPGSTNDGVHPNARGYAIWRHAIASKLCGSFPRGSSH